jgi:hypothetical protein
MENVVEWPILLSSEIDFPDCIADAISVIRFPVSVTRVGGLRHQHAHELGGNRSGRKLKSYNSALAIGNSPRRKILPFACFRIIHRIARAEPVLHSVVSCKRLRPSDTDCGNHLLVFQSDHNPLRVKTVILTSEFLCKVRIALPVGIETAVIEPRIPIEL